MKNGVHKNGVQNPVERGKQILTYALGVADGGVISLARKINEQPIGSAPWVQGIELLRSHMYDKGLTLDGDLWQTPLVLPASRQPQPGIGAANNDNTVASTGKTLLLVAMAAGVLYLTWRYALKDSSEAPRRRSYERTPGILGARRGWEE